MDTKFSEQDSLKLINEMITQTRNTFQKGVGNYLLYSGYCVAALAILNVILLHTLSTPYQSYWIWLLMFPFQFITSWLKKKQYERVGYKTHINVIINSTWGAFGIAIAVFLASVFILAFGADKWVLTLLITPTILAMAGICHYVMAVACRYKLYFWSAAICWMSALLSVGSYFTNRADLHFIILAACMVMAFVIPGHIVNKKAEEHV